jgi:hypothetical protein
MPIVEIYISHFGSERWDIDILGDNYLMPASSVLVNIGDGGRCRYDFKTVFDDGTTQIRKNGRRRGPGYTPFSPGAPDRRLFSGWLYHAPPG